MVIRDVTINHFHLFCGLGGGARGFNRGRAMERNMRAVFQCVGGVDSDPAAILDFEKLAGVRGTVLDLFSRAQYVAFHGQEPPADWREATAADLRRAAGNHRPHIILTSPPCKGFSGLLAESVSKTDKYQALNNLTVRGIWLALEAWSDDPPEFFVLENVPRIMNRGRFLLDQIIALLRAYGYAVRESVHDCGELGGLAQHRRRFLLVARHTAKVSHELFEPRAQRVRSVGEVLDKLPLPGLDLAGPMHRIPQLAWKTWVRLAFVEAGKDWRSLQRLSVEDGYLADYGIAPAGMMPAGAVAVSDPRPGFTESYSQFGVIRWIDTAPTLTSQRSPGQGKFAVADPRPNLHREKGDHYLTAAHYGVVPWERSSGAVVAAAKHDSGSFSVADPRLGLSSIQFDGLPSPDQKLACVIRAADGTWHRPFTTLELACLQSLIEPEEFITLSGLSDGDWRERIGNAIPPAAAEAMAGVFGRAILLSLAGETFSLSSEKVWVRPVAVSLALPASGDPTEAAAELAPYLQDYGITELPHYRSVH